MGSLILWFLVKEPEGLVRLIEVGFEKVRQRWSRRLLPVASD